MSDPIAIKCPNCASPIQTADWRQEEGYAQCGYCRAMVTLPGLRSARKRLTMPLPRGMSIEEGAAGTVITWRWFGAAYVLLAFFCVAWDGFLLFWYGVALTRETPALFKLFPSVHVVVGIAITYITLAGLLNRTWIKGANGVVTVLHGPLPWWGNLTVPCADIEQFFCKEKVSHGKHGPRHTYEVWAALRDNSMKKIVAGGLTDEQAIYIEQRLEQALGITDRPVAGEMMRA